VDPEVIKLFGVLAAIAVAGGFCVTLISVGLAFAKRIEGKPPLSEVEVTFLQDQAEEVEVLRTRLAELESRMDFAERVLAAPTGGPATAETPDGAARRMI
jgi:hypothetical protein